MKSLNVQEILNYNIKENKEIFKKYFNIDYINQKEEMITPINLKYENYENYVKINEKIKYSTLYGYLNHFDEKIFFFEIKYRLQIYSPCLSDLIIENKIEEILSKKPIFNNEKYKKVDLQRFLVDILEIVVIHNKREMIQHFYNDKRLKEYQKTTFNELPEYLI
jgi:hypothetical protein